jgi:hypothetical protein
LSGDRASSQASAKSSAAATTLAPSASVRQEMPQGAWGSSADRMSGLTVDELAAAGDADQSG